MNAATSPGTGQPRFRNYQVRIFLATWLAYAGYYFCRMNFYVVKATLQDQLGLSTTQLGHLGTAYLVGYMVGQFGSASAGRWLGPKRLLLAGTGISVLANLAMGVGNLYSTFLVFITLNGLAQGTGWPGCIGSLGYWFHRRQRGTVLGVWSTCYQAGPFLASNFAGLMLGLAGYRWAFFAAALVLLGVWALVLWLHPDTPQAVGLQPIRDDEPGPERPDDIPGAGSRSGLGWTWRVAVTILAMGGIYFCIKFSRYLLFSWTAFFLERNFGLRGDQAAYLSTVFYASGFAGVLLAGWASDRLFAGRRAAVAFFMMVGMTLAFAGLALGGGLHLVLFAVVLGLAGFMLYGPDSLISGVGAIDVGNQRGALVAAGIINGMGSAGPIVQEEAVARLYQSSGGDMQPVLWMLLAVAAAGTLLMGVLWWRKSL